MRKMIALTIVLVLLSSILVAQEGASEGGAAEDTKYGFKVGFEARIQTDMMYFAKGKRNNVKSKGQFHFLNSAHSWSNGDTVSLTLAHTGEHHEASVQFALNNPLTRKTGLLDIDGQGNSWQDLLDNSGIGDWWFKGDIPGEKITLDGFVGNTGYGGKVNSFGNFDDFLGNDSDMQLNSFGVWKPTGFQGSDAVDIWGDARVALGATYENFKLAVGSNLSYDEGSSVAGRSSSSVNAVFILSAENIADMVTVDLFYAGMGSDPNTKVRPVYPSASLGFWDHVFGIYAGTTMEDLGIGLGFGYTGNFRTYERSDDIAVKAPLFSGISIHANYTALENIDITLNNNLSFAARKGKNNKIMIGVHDTPLDQGEKDNWVAWHIALGASYALSDPVKLTLQLTNMLGLEHQKYASVKNHTTVNDLRGVIRAEYNVSKVTFGAGLGMGVQSESSRASKENVFTVGIPLTFKVAF